MLLRRCATIAWLLLMIGLLVSRCASQASHMQNVTSHVAQSPNLYKELMTITSNQSTPYDNNGDLSQNVLQNKDINELYDVTGKFRMVTAIVTPTSVSAQLPFVIFLHHTAIYHYIEQIDVYFQKGIAVIINIFDHSITTSNTPSVQPPQDIAVVTSNQTDAVSSW